MYDMERLLKDHSIPFASPGEHHHVTSGWVNIHCPFCVGTPNYHLGVSPKHGGCHCWRCGSHRLESALVKILNIPPREAKRILRSYETSAAPIRKRVKTPQVSIHPFKFPKPYGTMSAAHKEYLAKRDFDPDFLEREWSLIATGPISFLDGIPYNHRIIIPIIWDSEIVSFQARDITGKSDRKYLACPMKREVIHHKNIIYGKQELWNDYSAVVIVEGVTDVWRLGPRAIATLGIEFKTEQVLKLAKVSDRFFIIFDKDLQAQAQAKKLSARLKALGKEVYIETLEKGDPGDLKQSDADQLIKDLTMKGGFHTRHEKNQTPERKTSAGRYKNGAKNRIHSSK